MGIEFGEYDHELIEVLKNSIINSKTIEDGKRYAFDSLFKEVFEKSRNAEVTIEEDLENQRNSTDYNVKLARFNALKDRINVKVEADVTKSKNFSGNTRSVAKNPDFQKKVSFSNQSLQNQALSPSIPASSSNPVLSEPSETERQKIEHQINQLVNNYHHKRSEQTFKNPWAKDIEIIRIQRELLNEINQTNKATASWEETKLNLKNIIEGIIEKRTGPNTPIGTSSIIAVLNDLNKNISTVFRPTGVDPKPSSKI